MISILLIFVILGMSFPLFKNSVSNLAMTRLSSIGIIFSSFLIMNIFYAPILNDGLYIYSGFVRLNIINLFFQILLVLLGGLILIIVTSKKYFVLPSTLKLAFNDQPTEGYLNNYPLIIIFNLIGALFLMSAGDLLTLYIAIETQSFSLYILSTLRKNSVNSASAGLKYFLIGSLASAFILLGIALLYYSVGLTNFESLYTFFEIPDWFNNSKTFNLHYPQFSQQAINVWNFAEYNRFYFTTIFAIVTIITGILIKLGAAPFHQWTPDVYSLVPTAVTTWLVIIPKISLFILLFSITDLIIGTGNASGVGTFLDFTNELFYYFQPIAWHYYWLPSLYYDYLYNFNVLNKLNLFYGEALLYYPNYLQMEVFNYFNSPMVKFASPTFWNLLEYIDAFDKSSTISGFATVANSSTETAVAGQGALPALVDFNEYTWNNYFNTRTFYNEGSGYADSTLLFSHLITPLSSISIQNFLMLIAILSLIIGAIGGLYQIKIKRLLAYSAINHIGFLIIALCINNKVSLESFIFYLTQYSLTTLNIFLILIAFGYLTYTYGSALTKNNQEVLGLQLQQQNSDLNYIGQLTNLFNNNPMLTLSFVICLFSIAGTPPLLGFFAKQQVLLSALSVGFIFVSIIAINMSVISAFYYLKLIQVSSFIDANMPSTLKNIISIINKKQGLPTPSVAKHKNNDSFATNNLADSATPPYWQSQTNIISNDFFNFSKIQKSNIITSFAPTPIGTYTNLNLTFNFSNIHTYLISILTLIILFYTLKPSLLLNLTYILASYSYNL